MENKLNKIDNMMLMGPGPSCVPPEVYNALARPTLGHMDFSFIEIMDEIKILLQKLIQTDNPLTVPVSGTGSAGMEACFVNLIQPGDEVLILINGVFGKRMQDVAGRLGAHVDVLEFEWGTPVSVNKVKEALEKKTYDLIAMVHAETSTGVANPASEIGELIYTSCNGKTIYLLDTVTSAGGMRVDMDAWYVDALYSGTQKCLSCPPGLAPLSFSSKAIEKLQNRKKKVPNWYLDMSMIIDYWEGKNRVYHHTAPVNMLYGLYQALLLLFEEGLEKVFGRHLHCHHMLVDGLGELGLKMLVDKEFRLPMLNSVLIPDGVDDKHTRDVLRRDYLIEIGSGLGPLAGKVWRIGLMGYTAKPENVERLLNALREVL